MTGVGPGPEASAEQGRSGLEAVLPARSPGSAASPLCEDTWKLQRLQTGQRDSPPILTCSTAAHLPTSTPLSSLSAGPRPALQLSVPFMLSPLGTFTEVFLGERPGKPQKTLPAWQRQVSGQYQEMPTLGQCWEWSHRWGSREDPKVLLLWTCSCPTRSWPPCPTAALSSYVSQVPVAVVQDGGTLGWLSSGHGLPPSLVLGSAGEVFDKHPGSEEALGSVSDGLPAYRSPALHHVGLH